MKRADEPFPPFAEAGNRSFEFAFSNRDGEVFDLRVDSHHAKSSELSKNMPDLIPELTKAKIRKAVL
jgi:hypothetical protein